MLRCLSMETIRISTDLEVFSIFLGKIAIQNIL